MGFPEGPVIGVIIDRVHHFYKKTPKRELFEMIGKLLEDPLHFVNDEALGKAAHMLIPSPEPVNEYISLKESAVPWKVFGREHIDMSAIAQMEQASRIPVAAAGALMPDAHSGY